MEKEKFLEHLLQAHRETMNAVEAENPTMTLKARLEVKEGACGQVRYTFAVQSTSHRIKVSKMVEEKVYIRAGKKEAEGTVVDGYDDKLVVLSLQSMDGRDFLIRRNANHNNEILLRAAESFVNSQKLIHSTIYECYRRGNSTQPSLGDARASTLFNGRLNERQRLAALYSISDEAPFKILGPPGTGKTETVVEIISQHLSQKKSVLVCGPSNVSIDNIITRFLVSEYNTASPTKFYRLGSSFKGLVHFNLESMANESVGFMQKEEGDKDFLRERMERKREFIRSYKSQTSLVFSTLFSSLRESFFFDLCIVDEACQATELESFMAIVKGRKYILVGDPNQLCPTTSSLYEHLDLPTFTLNEQYRMHSDLLAFSNKMFYRNEIVSPKTDEFLFFGQSKILFIDTSYFGCEESEVCLSRANQKEACIIQDVVRWMGPACDIGIIAPYSAQVALLRELVECSVETVDGFQGQEKDFIILSLVRSNSECELGFLNDRKRMNVALTRCKRGLVVVGDAQNFSRDVFFRQFFRFLEDYALVVDPETFQAMANQHCMV